MISSSASLAIVLRESSDTRLMLLRLLIVREPARLRPAPPPFALGKPFELPGGDPGEFGRTSDCRYGLTLAPAPAGRGPRAIRGPRRRSPAVVLVGVPDGGVAVLVGDGLREPEGVVPRGVLERRIVEGTAVGGGVPADSSSTFGSMKWAGRGTGGGDSGSGGGSLNWGRGGRSSVSGGGSLNVG